MRKERINLHANRMWVLSATSVYAVLSILLVTIVILVGNKHLARLISLDHSSYLYSSTMKSSIGQDDYYRFDAGIGFTQSVDAKRGINADIIMQTAESNYTDSVDWNADKLSTHEIAVSGEIARENGIDVGSVLYSKHVVDGITYEYTITQVLPFVSAISLEGIQTSADGIIIMGYDEQYASHLSHTVLVFTKEPIESLTKMYSEAPVGIVYRDDNVSKLKAQLLPYIVLLIASTILLTVIFVFTMTRLVVYEFRRFQVLGFPKHNLNRSFDCYITAPFALAILCISIVSVTIPHLLPVSQASIWFPAIMLFVEVLAFTCTVSLIKWRVWRS